MRAAAVLLSLAFLTQASGINAYPTYEMPRVDKTLSPFFFEGGDPSLDRLPLKSTRVRAKISGVIVDVLIRAKIKEKEEAKREFLKAKAEGKTASLLEQKRPSVFKMSVANVMPGDKIDIELHYSELLAPTQGTYEFVYPTVVGPRFSDTLEADAKENDKWIKSPYT